MSFRVHGGRQLERERTGKNLVDFSANINPWGPPDALKDSWDRLYQYVALYPPLDPDYCRQAISRLTGLTAETILPTNGAMQAISLLARRLPSGNYLIFEPLFTEYARTFRLEGKQITHQMAFPHIPETESSLPWPVEGPDPRQGVILGNPGNPAGVSFPSSFLHTLCEWSRHTGAWLIVDEAFQDFMNEETSLTTQVLDCPRLLVIRSLTKYYSLAGLRGGYLVAHPDTIQNLEDHIEPWSVNAVLARALWILAESDLDSYRMVTRKNLGQEQLFIRKAFERWTDRVTLYPSQVNFFLAQTGFVSPDLKSFLFDRGVLVRSAADFWGLDQNYFRFAVRTHQENQILIKTMEEALDYV